MGAAVQVSNLRKSFGDNLIFQDVNFELNSGEDLVIVGGSGCGKSTLLRCLNRLVVPDCGSVLIDGQDILAPKANVDAIRRNMGMVYQQFNLFSHLNVMENMILAPMKVRGISQEEAIAEAEELLEMVGMNGRKYHMPSQLSGGQKQRVAIARTLAMHPKIILFDEPTSALDPTMVDEVENVIKKLIDQGMTSVIVTHEMRFARKVATEVIFLAEKTIYEKGTAEQVFGNPSRELTRQFLYRARMLNVDLNRESLDIYDLQSQIRSFALPYGLSVEQHEYVKRLCDELLAPLMKEGGADTAHFGLVCDEDGREHQALISFPTLEVNPLDNPVIDELNIMLLRSFSKELTSYLNGDSAWEVKALF